MATGAFVVVLEAFQVFHGRVVDHTSLTQVNGDIATRRHGLELLLEGERFVKAFARKYFIFRTAWLYGDGKNFAKTMLRLAENHEEVSVVCDQLGSPTSAVELARAIHHYEPTENYGLFHATCEGDTNWAAFAEAVFARAGKDTRVRHVTSEEYAAMNPASAKRPAYSILDNYMMRLTDGYRMADWESALDEYMQHLG